MSVHLIYMRKSAAYQDIQLKTVMYVLICFKSKVVFGNHKDLTGKENASVEVMVLVRRAVPGISKEGSRIVDGLRRKYVSELELLAVFPIHVLY